MQASYHPGKAGLNSKRQFSVLEGLEDSGLAKEQPSPNYIHLISYSIFYMYICILCHYFVPFSIFFGRTTLIP